MATKTDAIAEKKSKYRAKGGEHKRKLEEETEPEEVAVQPPTKKDKKKKNRNKSAENQEQEFVKENETFNGFHEEIKKKKKNKQVDKEENLSNGSAKKLDEVKKNGGEVRESADEGVSRVTVSGKDANESKYSALKSFSESGLPDKVLECCKNFDKPSPIQSNSWPFLLDGRDFIGIAKTGSGKTLAFGVPMMMHILSKQKDKSSKRVNPLCLVLSPTRELAHQIYDVLFDAGKPSGIRSVCVYGGTSKGPQKSSLRSGVDIVIGTPGRLRDLIEEGVCNLNEVSFVVLDEADRMLDMGFEQEVRSILALTSSSMSA